MKQMALKAGCKSTPLRRHIYGDYGQCQQVAGLGSCQAKASQPAARYGHPFGPATRPLSSVDPTAASWSGPSPLGERRGPGAISQLLWASSPSTDWLCCASPRYFRGLILKTSDVLRCQNSSVYLAPIQGAEFFPTETVGQGIPFPCSAATTE